MAREDYGIIEEDIIEYFNQRFLEFHFSITIDVIFQCNSKLKQMLKLIKIPDQYAVLLKKDLLVQINPEYFDVLKDDEAKSILFDMEIDKIQTNMDKGTFKISTKPELNANFGIIDKYSYEKVQRALEIEQHLMDKDEDGD